MDRPDSNLPDTTRPQARYLRLCPDNDDMPDNEGEEVLSLSTAESQTGPLGVVYALDDPRTGETRYVGATTQALEARLGSHLAQASAEAHVPAARREWFETLRAAGLVPHARVLERVPVARLAAAERRWINRLIADGAPLLNATRIEYAASPPVCAPVLDTDVLTAHEAAQLLGVCDRTVRRYIAAGKLAGQRTLLAPGKHIVCTTRAAVDALKAQGALLEGASEQDIPSLDSPDRSDSPTGSPAAGDGALLVCMQRIEDLARQNGRLETDVATARENMERLACENGRLQAEVGRLEAELALFRAQATGGRGQTQRGQREGTHAVGRQRSGVWGRMGLWLKRSTRG